MVLLNAVLNICFSEMTYFGVLNNSLFIVVIIYFFYFFDFKTAILFFVVSNSLLGPFMFVNFTDIGLPNVGRFDFWLSMILFIYIYNKLDLTKWVQIRNLVFVSFFIIILYFQVSYLDIYEKFDILFMFFGKMCFGFILAYLVFNDEKYKRDLPLYSVLFVMAAHLFIAIVQLKFPIYIRAGSIEAGLYILGSLYNRPLGLLESSYVFSIVTLINLLIVHVRIDDGLKRYMKFYYFLVLPLCLLSSRSTLLALLIVCLSVFYINNKRLSILFFIISITMMILNFNKEMLFIDQSNSTKFLLWFGALYNFINGNIFELLSGFGSGSSWFIADDIMSIMNLIDYQTAYDNHIDSSQVGFPIHNVIIQMYYEFGIVIGFLFTCIIIDAIRFSKDNLLIFSSIILIVINYSFHNGIFSSYLFFLMFISPTFFTKRYCNVKS